MHSDGPSNAVANQDDRGRNLTIASLDHIGYVTEGGRANSDIGHGINRLVDLGTFALAACGSFED